MIMLIVIASLTGRLFSNAGPKTKTILIVMPAKVIIHIVFKKSISEKSVKSIHSEKLLIINGANKPDTNVSNLIASVEPRGGPMGMAKPSRKGI